MYGAWNLSYWVVGCEGHTLMPRRAELSMYTIPLCQVNRVDMSPLTNPTRHRHPHPRPHPPPPPPTTTAPAATTTVAGARVSVAATAATAATLTDVAREAARATAAAPTAARTCSAASTAHLLEPRRDVLLGLGQAVEETGGEVRASVVEEACGCADVTRTTGTTNAVNVPEVCKCAWG
jgi:hypothetical protein